MTGPMAGGRRRSIRPLPPTLVVLALAYACPPSPADLVYFKKGGQAQVPARRAGGKVILDLPGESFEFVPEDFRAIVPGHDPASDWPAKLASARKGTPGDRFAAAWWALENGLTGEATRLLAGVLVEDPNHAQAASLVRALGRISPPLDDPEPAGLVGALGGTFREARSPHFLLLHQAGEAEATDRLGLLEQVYVTYYLTLAARGIELAPPRHRLATAVYARQADYLAFLDREHARAFGSTQGYYHPTRSVVVSFDPRDLPAQRQGRSALDAHRGELASLGAKVDRMPRNARATLAIPGEESRPLTREAARARLEAVGRDLSRRALLLELDRRAIDSGMAAHEAIHQLVAQSGLIRDHDDLPVWLHEGLACQFEVVRGGCWAGVGRAHDLRLPDWRKIVPAPRLAPLIRDEGFGRGYRRDLYAQAWALVYYLRKERPADFVHFLDRLRTPGPRVASRSLDAFRASFGDDLGMIEADWHLYLRRTKTPLDEELMLPPSPE